VKRILIKLWSRIFLILAWFSPTSKIRVFFHRIRGVKIGKNVFIGYFVDIDHNYPDYISIGDNSGVAGGCSIIAHDDAYNFLDKKIPAKTGKIQIGKNCFIGTRTVILPNVTISNKCLVGANSVVNKNISSNCIAAGSPVKIIKKING